MAFDEGRFYTPMEVWRGSHGPRDLIYQDLKTGRLKGIRRGRRWLIPGRCAASWLAEFVPDKIVTNDECVTDTIAANGDDRVERSERPRGGNENGPPRGRPHPSRGRQ